MSREFYVPIADSFWESSIMREAATVKFVMLSLIRLGLRPGANGVVDVDLGIFAASIGETAADVEAAIRRLMEPDPASASLDEDGRRIVPLDPNRPLRGWRLVNWSKYRKIVHRANDAARKRVSRHNGHDTTDASEMSENVRDRPETSGLSENGATKTKKNKSIPSPTGKGEVTTEENPGAARPTRFRPPTMKEISAYAISKGWTAADWSTVEFFESYGRKGWMVGKSPMKDWHLAAQKAHRDGWTIRHGNGEQRVVIHKNQRDLDAENEAEQIRRNREAVDRKRRAQADDERILGEVLEEKRRKQVTEAKP